jgi:hypothetical protein
LAVGVQESVERPVLAVTLFDDVLLSQDPANGCEPLLPLACGTRFVLGVQQQPSAGWAAAALRPEEFRGVLIHRGGSRRRLSAQ